MLRVNQIKMVNFGPYYGDHIIDFPDKDGVIIIWGNNGHGKTTIMNAFRYALWNEIFGRKKRILLPHTYVNTLSIPDKGSMKVELNLTYNDTKCIVTRGLIRTGGTGFKAEDYDQYFQMTMNGRVLSPDEADSVFSTALPEKISRFYLFDGELLDEYEDLLDDDDKSGETIKKAIEDILGLPILENAIANLDKIYSSYGKTVEAETKKESSNSKLLDKIHESEEELKHENQSKTDLEKEIDDLKREYDNINDALINNAKFSELATKKKQIEQLLASNQEALVDAKEKVKPLMGDAWCSIMNTVINSLSQQLSKSIEGIEQKDAKSQKLKSISDYIDNALSNKPDKCPVCDNGLNEQLRKSIKEKLSLDNFSELTEDEKHTLAKTRNDLNYLSGCVAEDKKEVINLLLEQVDNLQVDIDLAGPEIEQLRQDIMKLGSSSSEDEIMSLPQKLDKCLKKINEKEDCLSSCEEMIKTLNTAIDKYTTQILKNSTDPALQSIKERREFVSRIKSLMSSGISSFRDSLKNNVEVDASSIFKKISHEPEYDHLCINNNYGLRIMMEDDTPVVNRSSGYEQVVAISLIGSLHKNAPIEGPIFMDSTFQRVDGIHKNNTIDALPAFGHQVIVLAYDTEMGNVNDVKSRLGSKLIKEYYLIHPNSRTTKISEEK